MSVKMLTFARFLVRTQFEADATCTLIATERIDAFVGASMFLQFAFVEFLEINRSKSSLFHRTIRHEFYEHFV